jgi:predicted Zn-dependent peptidase
MTDAEIRAAREGLASFHERWFFEPNYRIVSDYMVAYAATGRDPRDVKKLPSEIRAVSPSDVRSAFDRYLLQAKTDVVILPP